MLLKDRSVSRVIVLFFNPLLSNKTLDRMTKHSKKALFLYLLLLTILTSSIVNSQPPDENQSLDEKVKKFLHDNSHNWFDMNVPLSDGQLLYDLIVSRNYKSALEIGTSTGHSGIWIAWALSKTGGKLITIEIDEGRYRTALENFRKAGLSQYIDARLADAHSLVKELKGPFDFVFSDADKSWYKNYFIDVEPKLMAGGCFTAHNVTTVERGNTDGQAKFLEYVMSLKNYQTSVDITGAGLSISYKVSDK
jgi:predicted O-methyltransferase YrrM